MIRSRLLTLVAAGTLGACTVGPDYVPPQPPSSPALQSGAFLRAGESVEAEAPAARWWEGMGDPVLSDMIDRGLRNAPEMAVATARLRKARAGLMAAKSNQLPTVGSSVLYVRAELPEQSLGGSTGSIDLFNVGFDAQWEADLWGVQRRNVEKSRAEIEAAGARLADAQVSLSAEIARNYISLRAREASLALLEQRRDLEDRNVKLAQQRFEGGTISRQSVEAALLQLRQTEVDVAGATADLIAVRDSLAVLVGAAPGMLDTLSAGTVPGPPASVGIGDPATMLMRRPDIRAAERKLAAATAQIGIEKGRYFPQVSFYGLIGIGGTSLSDVVDTSTLSAIALPRLNWRFLDFGRTKAAIRGAEADRDAAQAEYQASVLGALQDAEGALVRYGAARTSLGHSGDKLRHIQRVAELQSLRVDAGTVAQSEAIEARRDTVNTRIADTNERANLALAYVALAKSLGLGWSAAPAAPAGK